MKKSIETSVPAKPSDKESGGGGTIEGSTLNPVKKKEDAEIKDDAEGRSGRPRWKTAN